MSRRNYLPLLLLCLLTAPARAATPVSGDQSGTWTLAGSPYEIVGDVRVPPGETLTIEPGVTVSAQGYYRILVDGGKLLAVGMAAQPILMTTAPNLPGGWRGLRLIQAHNDSHISYCIIEYTRGTGAFPDVRGGAIYIQNCSPTVSHCELRFNFSGNANANGTGAGITTEGSSALILNNFIHDNEANSGGGLALLEYGTPRVIGNLIRDNRGTYAGGGVYMGARSSPRLERNLILHNHADGWGGGGVNSWTSYIFYQTFATLDSNIIAQNTASTSGGGIYARYDKCVVLNNTIADNTAAVGGGIFALNQGPSAPEVINTILWGNDASAGKQIGLEASTNSAILVSYSDIEGDWPGLGNIPDNPLFVDPAAADYQLQPGSPCIDTGWPQTFLQPLARDIDSQKRVWDGDGSGSGLIDIGADEFGSFVYGDLNCDGFLDNEDIDAFVLALTDPSGYPVHYPTCDRQLADLNGDGSVDNEDIDPFVALLTG